VGVEVDSGVRQWCEAGEYDRAATRAIQAYGPEIGRFIAHRVGNGADARDVFSMFCEDLWLGLPAFAWRCTLRGWAFTLARHAELRHAASPQRRPERNVALSDVPVLVGSRTSTPPYERTDVKHRFREIRSRLGEEDQLILILRVDRALEWRDIAHVLAAPGAPPAAEELRRQDVRIRKRFQLIKEKLRRWAAEEGLLHAQSTT
jgi:RNA polymerase sigma-70 factor (ECF subfamily)